tara:strand:+ start:28059 stop:28793 length:735 start_codon:yes stop_codon:yes gene_type:complete
LIFTRESQLLQLKEASIILLDKPINWTSFDAVKKLKYAISKQIGVKARKFKIGHAGTLDPLATGLLILCTGKATKSIQGIQDAPKSYEGTFELGATTPSYDLETEVDQKFSLEGLTESDCQEATKSFLGEIDQTPPIFSAIWVDGVRAYKLARKGEDVKLKSRKVSIHTFDVDAQQLPTIKFKVNCSKGTYIRSLANDFGAHLNNGAYLSSLRRTAIGDHKISDSWNIEDLIEFINTFERNESL